MMKLFYPFVAVLWALPVCAGDNCDDPAYKEAFQKFVTTKLGSGPNATYFYKALVVFVGQPAQNDIQGYWQYLPVSVKSFPGVDGSGVVIGLHDSAYVVSGGVRRAVDLKGWPAGYEIYQAWLKATEPSPMPQRPRRQLRANNWLDNLTAVVSAVASGRAGQAGRLTVEPPDARSRVRLVVKAQSIELTAYGAVQTFAADKAADAVSAYCAAVEGGA